LRDYNWVTGRATSIVIDPNDPSGNTIYAGGAYAGVWKSTNAGPANPNPSAVAWTPLTDNQPTLAIGAIAVQPQVSSPDPNASVILAGTGETDGGDSYYGLGILRSADAGQNWTLISQYTTGAHSFAGLGFSSIAFSTTNPNLVVAATAASPQGIIEGLENPVAVNRGIYYSTDGGISWNAAALNDAGVSAPSDSVTSVAFNASAGLFYAAVRFHGIYSSSDGSRWSRLSTQPGAGLGAIFCPPQRLSSCPIYRGQTSVVPNRPAALNLGEMYVWYVDESDNDQGIWQSLDGGGSWKAINDSGITNCGDTTGCGTVQGSYNLMLAAVANGMATDLYAGAVNLYKCSINILFPACANTGTNTFMNLTHVYGCSDIAKVHPAQHAIDSRVLNGTLLLYFANDGGIYHALDGYTGVTHGTCGLSNQFDSLNETLGPMTQFVSLAQSSSDPNLIFGGTQNNGTPATAFSQSGGAWANVNAGDSGSTAVNPANDSEWFVATPPDSHSGVNLFRCANGVNCHTQDFQGDQIAGSNLDTGPPDLPFILDPQNAGTFLLGTCRIWRGTTSGGAFQLLSPNFETGGAGTCIGTETNQVRAIAAGGAAGSGGNSQVIYAATNGAGPIIPSALKADVSGSPPAPIAACCPGRTAPVRSIHCNFQFLLLLWIHRIQPATPPT
jgi:hypothetical protein